MNEPLTERQQEILAYLESQEYMPTRRELMRKFAIGSPNGIQCHLHALQKKGAIEIIPGKHGGIRLKKKPSGWQPIETAPKDGTFILVYDGDSTPDDWIMVVARWCFPGWRPVSYENWSFKDPTHWMPLPNPPQGLEKEKAPGV